LRFNKDLITYKKHSYFISVHNFGWLKYIFLYYSSKIVHLRNVKDFIKNEINTKYNFYECGFSTGEKWSSTVK